MLNYKTVMVTYTAAPGQGCFCLNQQGKQFLAFTMFLSLDYIVHVTTKTADVSRAAMSFIVFQLVKLLHSALCVP